MCPKSWDYDDLGAGSDELAEGFRESKVPADEESDGPQRGCDCRVWGQS